MAECPNCGRKLGLKDWRQTCPGCGVNLILFDRQERLMKEADVAEVQHYYFQKKIDRVKAAFIGSKLAIARIFISILPLIPPLLPLVRQGKLSPPLPAVEGNISLLSVYQVVSREYDASGLASMFSGDQKTAATFLAAAVLLIALALVLTIVRFALNSLACSPKGKVRNYTEDILLLLLIVGAGAVFAAMPENSLASGKAGIGWFLWIATALACLVVDILCFTKGIEVKHAPCFVGGIPAEEYFDMVDRGVPQEEIRAEMYKRLTALRAEKEAALKAAGEEGSESHE